MLKLRYKLCYKKGIKHCLNTTGTTILMVHTEADSVNVFEAKEILNPHIKCYECRPLQTRFHPIVCFGCFCCIPPAKIRRIKLQLSKSCFTCLFLFRYPLKYIRRITKFYLSPSQLFPELIVFC